MSKKVFICASEKEEDLKVLDRLDAHLSGLRRGGKIEIWYGNNLDAGSEVKKVVTSYIKKADIILLLISADFWASDFCHNFVLEEALKRASKVPSRVKLVPILARAFAWEDSELSKFQALPNALTPVVSHTWKDEDKPYKYIVNGIKKLLAGQAITPYAGIPKKIKNDASANIINAGNGNITGNNNQINISTGSINIGNNQNDLSKQASDMMQQGNTAYRLKNYRAAIELYEQAKDYNPNDSDIYFNLGQCYRKLEDIPNAFRFYDEAIARDPTHVKAHLNRGWLYESIEKDYAKAMKDYKEAIKYKSGHHGYFRIAFLLQNGQDRPDEAIKYYEKYIEGRPNDPIPYFNIGRILYKKDKYKEAIKYFTTTVQYDANYYLGYAYLGYAHYNLGNYRAARKNFDTSLKINPKQEQVIAYRKKADSYIWW